MKPHPSHRFERMPTYDVVACVRCYAEPWWPIAEQRCSSEGADASERYAVRKATARATDEQIVAAIKSGKPLRRITTDLRTTYARVAALAKANGGTP